MEGTGSLRAICKKSSEASRLRKELRTKLKTDLLPDILRESPLLTEDLPSAVLFELGLPADIVADFSNLVDGCHLTYLPSLEGFTLTPEAADLSLQHIRLQMPQSPLSVSYGLNFLRDILAAFPNDVEILLLLRPGASPEGLRQLAGLWGQDTTRLTIVEQEVTNLFARDNMLPGSLASGEAALLLPRLSNNIGADQREEAKELSARLGLPVALSKLYWEGGNILFDGRHCLIGANTIARNRRELGLSPAQIKDAFAAELGAPVTVLGDVEEAFAVLLAQEEKRSPPFAIEGGQADFHIDLDIAFLGDGGAGPQVALADAEVPDDALTEILAHDRLFEGHFLPPDIMREIFLKNTRATAARRAPYLASYRAALEDLGYEVVSLPGIGISPDLDYLGRVNTTFNYANVLPAASATGQRQVYLLPFGVSSLDDAAANTYLKAGLEPIFVGNPKMANELLTLNGGLHCLCSKLA